MPSSRFPRIFAAFVLVLLLCFSVLISLTAQNTQPSPTPGTEISPSPSVSPTPVRRDPTPTPLPQAQNAHQWGSVTVFNGLPSDAVRAISQTPDGVMWFGTDNGLARFDGRRIQKFSLGGNDADRVLALKTSASGELWIGTRNGAFVYADGRFRGVENTTGASVTSILLTGETYLATDGGQVIRVRAGENGTFFAENLLPEALRGSDGGVAVVTSLVEAGGKVLAATSGGGVFVVNGDRADEFKTAPRPIFVNSLARDASGKLWLGTEAAKGASGVFRASENSRSERIPAPTADVFTLEANDGGIWAGTERYGLFHVVEGKLKKTYTFANTSGGLRSDTIFTLFTDREGVLWIGTNRGVSRFDRGGADQETVSDIPNRNFIRALWRSEKTLYAGSNRGLFEQKGERWDLVPGFEEKVIYALQQGIVGTSTGVFDVRRRSIATGDTRSLANFGRMYAAILGRGVVDISNGKQDVIFSDPTACSLSADADKLWIGTMAGGLYSFDGKAIKPEVSPEVLKGGTIWRMNRDPDGNLWIAAQHGVLTLQAGAAEKVIEAEDVRDVFVEGRDVWAATTTQGLLHARRDDRFGWLVSSVGFEQGLPSEKAFSILPGNNGLLIATNRGVVTYRPGTTAPKIIPIRVLSQRVHDLAELASTVALEYPQNSLLVEVAGLSSRTFPEEFQYAYVLTNAKGEAVDTRLTNDPQYAPKDLSPGEYAIEVRAFDRDLNMSEALFIRFSAGKAPFPWTATALAVLLAIALFGLVWAVIEHRRITQRNRELAAARFDLANEAERERRRIARDLHDQTLADLRNLMLKSDKLATENGSFRSEIEAVSTEIRRICEDLSPSALENVGLVAALESLLTRSFEDRDFSAEESVEERLGLPLNVQMQIYRIAQEVLSNIERHSNASRVKMSVTVDNGRFLLTIRDDGRAFEPNGMERAGRGIANIRARASLINGRVSWRRSGASGNVFSLAVEAAKVDSA